MTPVKKTGYVYDPIFLAHTYAGHPESAQRLEAICRTLEAEALPGAMERLPTRPASFAELGYVHPQGYIQQIKRYSEAGGGMLDVDTYTTRQSFEAAATAAGSLIDLTLAVWSGQLRNGFAIVRPPGHHATQNQSMGFCLFSNVAIAARAAQRQGARRVAVVDFDVHHGNGTQAVLDDESEIFFISTHQYPLYPGTGRVGEIGVGRAEGTKANFPLPAGVGDEGFKGLYDQLIIPLLRRFQPDLMLVSAGYDCHWDDPLANMGLSLTGLTWISQTLVDLAEELCQGKIVFALEGGYNLNVLGHGVSNSIKALLGRRDTVDPLGRSARPEPDLDAYVVELKKIHHL